VQGSSGDIGIGTGTITNTSNYRNIHIEGTTGTIMRFMANGTQVGQIQSDTNEFQINAVTSDPITFKTNNAERMRINSSGHLQSPPTYSNVTAAAANVHIEASVGQFYRSTSSRRYKNTITESVHGLTELLTLRPVTYKGNNDGDTVFGGLIAEEVHDAGLTEFVQYNDDNEPDALSYGNMVSLCIKAIQEQQATITALEARIATLEAGS